MEEEARGQETTAEPDIPGTAFTFVVDETQRGLRSHAMREHWKQRRRAQQMHSMPGPSQPYRHLQPKPGTRQVAQTDPGADSARLTGASTVAALSATPPPAATQSEQSLPRGIPAQALLGMDRVLSCSRLDPFDSFPVNFTAEHHKLIHHCESIHGRHPVDLPLRPAD